MNESVQHISQSRRVVDWIESAANRIDLILDRHFWKWASVIVAISLLFSIYLDVHLKMWVDEFYTLLIAKQANVHELVKAISEGCDGQPPLYSILVHYILHWIHQDALAARLLSTIGYYFMPLCVAAFCRRRMPATYALCAELIAIYVPWYYATEGRSYGLLIGFAGIALYCWQLAVNNRHRRIVIPIFALCLTAMTALHYFSMFFAVPFVVGEIVRRKTSKKIDWPILASMLFIPLVLVFHYPLIVEVRHFQSHFWAQPGLFGLYWGVGDSLAWKILNIAILLFMMIEMLFITLRIQFKFDNLFNSHEWSTLATFFVLPSLVAIMATFTTHSFTDRYNIWAIPALSILAVALICTVVRCRAIIGAGLLIFMITFTVRHGMLRLTEVPRLRQGQAAYNELAYLPINSLPIVISGSHAFIELSYYAPTDLSRRFIYINDAGLDLEYYHNDTDAHIFDSIKHRAGLPIIDYKTALAEYPHFYLVSYSQDYRQHYLVSIGYKVKLLHSEQSAEAYEVMR